MGQTERIACLEEDTFLAWVSGKLDATRLRHAEAHVADCEDCQFVLAAALRGVQSATHLPLRATGAERGEEGSGVARARGAAAASGPGSIGAGGLPGPGEILAHKYGLEEVVGSGGMGVLFAARHLELGHRVAIKVLHLGGPDATSRFLREARIYARLSSQHVPHIYDVGRLPNGAPFIAMEFLVGEDLARVAARGPTPISDAADYVLQACRALGEAHRAGIVHRDLKPANLFLVTRPGEAPLLKVLDFGISKFKEDQGELDARSFTATSHVLGSPLYMSPEQIQDSKNVDLRTDIWSLGVVLYQLLTGRAPFHAQSFPGLCVAIATEAAVAPCSLRPDLPLPLEAVILHCLEKRREDRLASSADLARALEPFVSPAFRAGSPGNPLLAPSLAPVPQRSGDVRRSVAVLGFQDLSALTSEGWVSTALAQLVTAALMGSGELRLLAAERVAQVKRELHLGVLECAGAEALQKLELALRVDFVVVGSFLRRKQIAPERELLKLQVQVKVARSGETLLSLIDEGQESDLFEMAARTTARISERLGLSLPSPEEGSAARKALPSTAQAARYYAEGLVELYGYRPSKAFELLSKAAELEPDAPLVQNALARAANMAGRDQEAKLHAARATALSGVLSREARLAVKAQSHVNAGEWKQAIAQYQALFTLYPDELDYGLQLARAQGYSGNPRDALATIDALRELPTEISDDPRLDYEEARAAHLTSSYERCLTASRHAVATAVTRESWGMVARAGYLVGIALMNLDQPEEGLAELLQARDTARAHGDLVLLGFVQPPIATQYLTRGELTLARAELESALEAATEVGNAYIAASINESMAKVDREAGRFAQARARVLVSIAHYRENNEFHALSTAFAHLAGLEAEAGELQAATEHAQLALDTSRKLGRKLAEADALLMQAAISRKRGRLDDAYSLVQQAECLARETANQRQIAAVLEASGEHHRLRGEMSRARALFEQALDLKRNKGDLLGARQIENQLLRVALLQGRAQEAATTARAVRLELEALGADHLAKTLLVTEIRSLAQAGRAAEAQSLVPLALAEDDQALGFDLVLQLRTAVAAARLWAGDLEVAATDLTEVIAAARRVGLEERASLTAVVWLETELGVTAEVPKAVAEQLLRARALGWAGAIQSDPGVASPQVLDQRHR